MNYYNEIKNELIKNEINIKVKNYSINKGDLNTKYNIGKLLSEAGKHYGEGIMKEYSIRLTRDLCKRYSITTLKYIRQFYEFSKSHTVSDQLTYTHYKVLLSLTDNNEINYYINLSIQNNLSVRNLISKIKLNEYERLDESTKLKLIKDEKVAVKDLIPNPIIIKNNNNYEEISEKVLQKLILEDLPSFLKELGNGFSFIGSEYKIKIEDRYNYIDLLLFNYEYNCFIVVELKVTELKKEHIGQIQVYMNYIDSNLRKIIHDKTIGIIICKKNNKYIIEYCSDKRIVAKEYKLM